ncbi:MAG: EAL domain-containing protein [Gammaproteobacteria bacterium]|nr:EAL domain-containing protein [Gammaproteobacteria bacterium]MDH5617429.1 EAL domain-containing protein [Gammaproteobacteria bacterium]
MSASANESKAPLALIIDDDTSQLIIMEDVLLHAGFRVSTACTGSEGFEKFRNEFPDIVLLDVEMPGMSGFEVCRAMRALEQDRQVPILMVTGHDDNESVQLAYDLGATDFITKPISWPILPHRLQYVLRAHNASKDLRGLIQALPDLIFAVNADGEYQETVSSAEADLSRKARALGAASQVNFYPCEGDSEARACIRRAIEFGKPQVYEYTLEEFGVDLETRFVARDDQSVLAIIRDITERKKSEARIYKLAYFDELTSLPNRQLIGELLEKSIDQARANHKKFAILFIDLDRFKRINDSLGHTVGDELLKGVAARLLKCTRSTDRHGRSDTAEVAVTELARFGGDEFILKVGDVKSEAEVSSVAARVIEALSSPFECLGHHFSITPSIGIAMFPSDGSSSEDLIMNADAAMYRAKAAGRNNYKFYSETMRTRSLHRLDLENEISAAIDQQQFKLHYQPKVDVDSWSIVGVEALLRWTHPERGKISPDMFIPVAEETGLIVPIDRWVIRESCRQIRRWSQSLDTVPSVSVNLSAQHFHSESMAADVLTIIREEGIAASQLELEITENVLLHDIDRTVSTLRLLKKSGIRVSVDDFGTGYSSLSYLKRLPIDTLKIDRSFVKNLHHDEDDAAICAAILAMARRLNLSVVAEGVELQEQLNFLRRNGCDLIQGYLYSEAVPPDEIIALLPRLRKKNLIA